MSPISQAKSSSSPAVPTPSLPSPDLPSKLTPPPGTGGVGKQAILQLAANSPSHIFFTGRNQTAATSIISTIAASSPATKVTFLPMELGSLADIKSTAEKVLAETARLDIFIANAGIMSSPGVTKDGYEIQFGTNHLGNTALLLPLLPLMVKTQKEGGADSDVRFVSLTSQGYRGHPSQGIVFDTLKSAQPEMPFGDWQRYGQSKLANILFAKELARRYPDFTSVAIHPGVVETEFVSGLTFWNRMLVRVTHPMGLITPEQGGVNTVWAAAGKDVKQKLAKGNVAFFEPVGRPTRGDGKCYDEALMKKLWEWTEEQVGVKAPAA